MISHVLVNCCTSTCVSCLLGNPASSCCHTLQSKYTIFCHIQLVLWHCREDTPLGRNTIDTLLEGDCCIVYRYMYWLGTLQIYRVCNWSIVEHHVKCGGCYVFQSWCFIPNKLMTISSYLAIEVNGRIICGTLVRVKPRYNINVITI